MKNFYIKKQWHGWNKAQRKSTIVGIKIVAISILKQHAIVTMIIKINNKGDSNGDSWIIKNVRREKKMLS